MKCQELSAVMTESDMIEECEERGKSPDERYGIINSNYFQYQPVTLNQIDEAKS